MSTTIDSRRRTWHDPVMGDTPHAQTVWKDGQCVGLITGERHAGVVNTFLVLRPHDLAYLHDDSSLVGAQQWAVENL